MQLTDIGRRTEYAWLPQPEILSRLADKGVNITSQTLRNWERNALLTPPKRGGRKGGRTSDYCEFSLAEAFAVYKLTQAELTLNISETVVPMPKYSLLSLSIAREQLRKAGCSVPHYPVPPTDSVIGIHYLEPYADMSFRAALPLPDFCVGTDGKIQAEKSFPDGDIDTKAHLQYHFFQTLYVAWFHALSLGCDMFLSHYRK